MNDDASIGQASAAVAAANDAIDNARRAAASSRESRSRRNASARVDSTQGNAGLNSSYSGVASDMDMKHNDNAYHVIATLVTERLLPKINASPGSTHYTLTAEDTAFFQQMLPYTVRRSFVDALRYRLQLYKSGVGNRGSSVGKLSMQCQLLGLDRENLNVLLDLSQSAGMSVSFYEDENSHMDFVSRGIGWKLSSSHTNTILAIYFLCLFSIQSTTRTKDR